MSRAVLVVDGMNVIGSRPDGWWRDRHGAQRALLARLASADEHRDQAVTVVFDGGPPPEGMPAPAGVTVVFTPGSSADDEIVRRVREEHRGATVTVVTSDNGLAGRVRAEGAEVVPVQRFRATLGPPPEA